MTLARKIVTIRDSTLREGLDTPRVFFSIRQKLTIARHLAETGVREVEIVAPGRVLADLGLAKRIRDKGYQLKTSGLIYCSSSDCEKEIAEAAGFLDRFDLLMPLSPLRQPAGRREKAALLKKTLSLCSDAGAEVGAGFPQSTQDADNLLPEISRLAVSCGARRIVVYDTNGSGSPKSVGEMIRRLKSVVPVPVFFHGHNDLGLATANSIAAVEAGADGLDVTVNGLGDRAGNACLEQIVLNLELMGCKTGIDLGRLRMLSKVVEKESGVPVSKLAPVTGEYVFQHKSVGHLAYPELFQAYDPALTGVKPRIVKFRGGQRRRPR